MSSSSRLPMPQFWDDDLTQLVAQFYLEDIQEMRASFKGKSRAGTALTDFEFALQCEAEEMSSILTSYSDHRFAQSIRNAVDTDHAILQAASRVAARETRDHEIALALSRGLQPPPPLDDDDADKPISPQATSRSGRSNDTPTIQPSIHSKASVLGGRDSRGRIGTQTNPSNVSGDKKEKRECVICGDNLNLEGVTAPCGHSYDTTCLVSLFTRAMEDEGLFPPRCCGQNIPLRDIQRYLPSSFPRDFALKQQEVSTVNRVYCPSPTCSRFLGAATTTRSNITCPACGTRACTACKAEAHLSWVPCKTDQDAQKVIELAGAEHWQRCPGCHQMVELDHGCNHMTCRCRTQFCYICAAPWKTCSCPQWDESRLLVAAERRVANIFDARPGPANAATGAIRDRRVQAAVEHLRFNHECAHHSWSYRSGGGRCETCAWYLPNYLLRCNGCATLSCRRCRYNRF